MEAAEVHTTPEKTSWTTQASQAPKLLKIAAEHSLLLKEMGLKYWSINAMSEFGNGLPLYYIFLPIIIVIVFITHVILIIRPWERGWLFSGLMQVLQPSSIVMTCL